MAASREQWREGNTGYSVSVEPQRPEVGGKRRWLRTVGTERLGKLLLIGKNRRENSLQWTEFRSLVWDMLNCKGLFNVKGAYSQSYMVFMYGCESWTIKKVEHRRTDAFNLWCQRRLESPLDFREIQPVNLKGNQPWIVIGRTDAEAETPILWRPDEKKWLTGKDLDAKEDWRQKD